jgi:hypothetical protein
LPATATEKNVAGLGGRLTRNDGGRRIGKKHATPVYTRARCAPHRFTEASGTPSVFAMLFAFISVAACVSSASKNVDVARSLIKFLTAPTAAPVFKTKDIEPG